MHLRSHQNTPAAVAAALVPPALTALFLAAWSASRYGVGVSPDSAHYIGAARSLAAGHGLQFNGAPFTHWPPLYPLLLSLPAFVGVDPLHTACVLATLLYAVNTILVALLAYRAAARSLFAALCAGFLFALSPEMLHLHTMAWSEPPFICLGLLAVLVFSRATPPRPGSIKGLSDAPARPFLAARRATSPPAPLLAALRARRGKPELLCSLAVVGLLTGLAVLTRFVGVTLLPPFLFCILMRPGAARSRAFRAAYVSFFAALPVVLWLLWKSTTGSSPTDRPIAFHPPHSALALLPIFAALAACILLTYLSWHRGGLERRATHIGMEPRRLEGIDHNLAVEVLLWSLAFIATYCMCILFGISFLDALTPIDARIMAPVLLFGALAIPVWLWSGAAQERAATASGGRAGKGGLGELPASADESDQSDRTDIGDKPASARRPLANRPWRVLFGVVLAVACTRGGAGFTLARAHHENGYGYTSRAWRASPTLHWLDSRSAGPAIYSNAPELIAFRTGRAARALPAKLSATSLLPNGQLEREIEVMRNELQRGGIIIYFPSSPRYYLLASTDLEKHGIPTLLRLPDGIVYGIGEARQ